MSNTNPRRRADFRQHNRSTDQARVQLNHGNVGDELTSIFTKYATLSVTLDQRIAAFEQARTQESREIREEVERASLALDLRNRQLNREIEAVRSFEERRDRVVGNLIRDMPTVESNPPPLDLDLRQLNAWQIAAERELARLELAVNTYNGPPPPFFERLKDWLSTILS